MNKQDFLNTVKISINSKSQDALKKLLLDFSRLIPYIKYEEAMQALQKSDDVLKTTPVDLQNDVKQLCEKVSNGDYGFSWSCEDDYYDRNYYYYENDETLIDENGLGQEIQALLEAAVIYVNERKYHDAFWAFDALYSLSISVEDYDDVDIDMMFSQNIIDLESNEILLHYAYTAIMTLRGRERAQKLYDIMRYNYYGLKMSDIISIGTDDIPEREEFGKQWIDFLLNKNLFCDERDGHQILIDAVLFSGGIKALHDFTKEHGRKYPSAYIRAAEIYMEEKDYSQAISIISDGFLKLRGINHSRTRLADLLLNIGNATNDRVLIDKAVWEGFRSSADLAHFINICHLNNENLKDKAKDYLNQFMDKAVDGNYIRFLCGDYEAIYNACESDKKYLGWSTSEKGKMLPLFITLLARTENLTPCMKKLIGSNFYNSNIQDVFFQTLIKSYKSLSKTEWEKYFEWCQKETKGRVEAIVKGQHRGSYYKASALIVSLAEILRISGDEEGAVSFIIKYKEKYPYHSSFRKCLREDSGEAKFDVKI